MFINFSIIMVKGFQSRSCADLILKKKTVITTEKQVHYNFIEKSRCRVCVFAEGIAHEYNLHWCAEI